MKEVLISFSVFLACIIIAVASQIISPTEVSASNIDQTIPSAINNSSKDLSKVTKPFELDPSEVNPTLFAMAKGLQERDANYIGGTISSENSIMTDTGLQIIELKLGDGAEATAGQNVSVNYRGTLENGKEFDSSYQRGPFDFPLGAGRVIKGWDEGVAGMKVGGKRKLIIPSDLGYGSRGAGGGLIPPNATLIFEIELLGIN